MSNKKHYLIPLITAIYILLLLVGSTYPFTDWQWPAHESWLASFESATRYVPRSDVIINYLIYVPLGILISIQLRKHINYTLLLVTSTVIAASIGLTLEVLQLFIPSRAHSFIDLLMNTSGAFTGALLHHFTKKHSALGQYLRGIRYTWFVRGRYTELGMAIIALWALSETSPFAVTLDVKVIAQDLDHFTNHLLNITQWNSFKTAAFAFEVFGLLLIAEFILINKVTNTLVFGTFAGVILYLKIPIADTQLSPEFFWGFIGGIIIFFLTQRNNIKLRVQLAMYALFFAYMINQLNHPVQIPTETFNWLPFDSDEKRIHRVTEILSITWIFLALSFFALSFKQASVKRNGVIGLITVGVVALLLEWQQQSLQNTSADITDVLVAMFAWALPYFHPEIRRGIRLNNAGQ